MSTKFNSLDLANRCRSGLLQVAISTLLSILLSATPASSQSKPVANPGDVFDDLPRLYECGSYYTVINFCYKHGGGEVTEEMNATAFKKRDKIIHLIFINGRRAGVPPETYLSDMQSSASRMLKAMDIKCEKLGQLTSNLGPACEGIIKDVPQPPYDKGERSGTLDGFSPTPIG